MFQASATPKQAVVANEEVQLTNERVLPLVEQGLERWSEVNLLNVLNPPESCGRHLLGCEISCSLLS